MKLLFDENLSFRLVPLLSNQYPESVHVRDLGLVGASDEEIWSHAKQYGFVLISKDVDFYQRSILRGAPPKVVWLRVGNASTSTIQALLLDWQEDLQQFVDDDEASFLTIGPT